MVGSATTRRLLSEDCEIITVNKNKLDLRNGELVYKWMKSNKPEIVTATITISVVWVVSVLVGQTTLLISVLESSIIFRASFPSVVENNITDEMATKNTTPKTLYNRGSEE